MGLKGVAAGAVFTPSNVAITGGTINGTPIGGTTPAAGAFTTLSASGAISGAGLSTRSYLAGCTLSTAGSSATMSIAAGVATDSTNVSMMQLAAIAKTTSAWSVGTAQGGLDTGTIANATWYHFFVIQRTDTGVVDVLISLSATAPTMPTNYTLKRRIGSGKTNGSAQWVAFTQDGDLFELSTPVLDINSSSAGTSAVTRTLASVPTGVNVKALLNVRVAGGAATEGVVYISDLATTDVAASTGAAPLGIGTGLPATSMYFQASVRTNTSAQFRSRESAADSIFAAATLGWIDRRGQDN